MSKQSKSLNWINALPRDEVEAWLTRAAEAEDNLRLQLIDVTEMRKHLEFRHNRLRREAGEIS
jgi:hypothetical protein